jgi:hypothetical protein
VNIVSKSGSNNFHGSLLSSSGTTRWIPETFGHIPQPFRLNQFGGNLGGPIWKNRTFFFR